MATGNIAPPLKLSTKIAYAFSGMPALIEQRGLSTFLLVFYNQVIGLQAGMVATVLLISSICDAIFDPIVGQFSDDFRSRWGRRHPFMYLAIIPLSLSYVLLWAPPAGWSQNALFFYLLGTLIIVRLSDSVFELPAAALLPELTQDYNDRTRIISLRLMLGLLSGMVMTMLAYRVFLREDVTGGGGVLARSGYFGYGLCSALVIVAAILIASLGTHRRIPFLARPQRRSGSLSEIFQTMRGTLGNPSLVALLCMGVLMSTSNGAKSALDLYFGLYFWGLSQSQLAMLVAATFVGTVLGVLFVSPLSRRVGKRRAAAYMMILGIVGNVGPVLGRLVGIMPANGSSALFTILFVDNLLTFCVATMTSALMSSMLSDVVEDSEVRTGRRSEGLVMAADNVVRKLVASVGIFVSGVLLTVINFPTKAARGAVPPEVVAKLAYGYLPITVFYLVALCILSFYRINKRVHEANVETLRQRLADEA